MSDGLPTHRPKHGPAKRSLAATMLLANGIGVLIFGAFCYCFPQVIEGIHPHRQGEAEILGSIRSGAAILGLLGVLYTYVGWSNMQGYMHGLLVNRIMAIPLLYFCYHFGQIYLYEWLAFVAIDPFLAIAIYILHRQRVKEVTKQQ